MRFDLTDEQKALRDMLTAFLRERFGAAQLVEATRDVALDSGLWDALFKLGLGLTMMPAEHDGLDGDLLTLAVIAETLGHYAVPAPVVPAILAAWLVATAGDEGQRARWLEPLASEGAVAAFALAEEGGWTESAWTIEEAPRISGRKLYVERADEADLLIVGLRGGRIALVDTKSAGVSFTPIDTNDRTRPLCEVAFENTEASLLGHPQIVEALIDALLVAHAADALGAASAGQERAVGYAVERKQFGRLIGSFQALKHQLADMSVEIEPARSLVWYAAHAWDTGRDDRRRMAALAKAHLGDIAVATSRSAVEAHGGIGYTWEHPMHVFLKRAMHDRAAMGDSAFHRERMAHLSGW